MVVMVSVATMHEQMHQGTGEQRQPDQHSQYVSLMFGEQQRTGDDQKPGQDKSDTISWGHSFPRRPVIAGMVWHRHCAASILASKPSAVARGGFDARQSFSVVPRQPGKLDFQQHL
jgi:hypothetical protein